MQSKVLNDYPNYTIYSNGTIYNKKGHKIVHNISKSNQAYIALLNNGQHKSFSLARLIYETFNDEILTNSDIIRFKDGDKNNFDITNLIKIKRSDMFRAENIFDGDIVKNNDNKTNYNDPEIWRDIKNYENDYKISKDGKIYSIKYDKLMEHITCRGNVTIKLIRNNTRTTHQVCHLVYNTFIGFSKNFKDIQHKDGDKSNNNINNLKEITLKQKIPTIKCIRQYSLDKKLIKVWKSIDEIKENLKEIENLDEKKIIKCCDTKIDNIYGYIWTYYSPKNKILREGFVQIKTLKDAVFSDYSINKNGEINGRRHDLITTYRAKGFNCVLLKSDDEKQHKFRVCDLMAITFLENNNNYKYVEHIDNDITNDKLENLRWSNKKYILPICNDQNKKIEQIDIDTGKVIMTHDSINRAFEHLGKTRGKNIRQVLTGERCSAFGYFWREI
jgi:hypothetical protein